MINNSQGNISQPEPSYSTTAGFKYFNTAEAQGKDPKTNLMKVIEVLKEEINKSLTESQENTKKLEEIHTFICL